jgi:uncharacterized membrane protein (Fun14 family)
MISSVIGRRSLYLLTICSAFKMPTVLALGDDQNDDKFTAEKFTKGFTNAAQQSLSGINPDALFATLSMGPILEIEKMSHGFFESTVPGKMGFGFVMGFSSGYFLKQSSKMIAFTVGGLFIFVQVLSSNGFVYVNYDKIVKEFEVYPVLL